MIIIAWKILNYDKSLDKFVVVLKFEDYFEAFDYCMNEINSLNYSYCVIDKENKSLLLGGKNKNG